MCRARTQEQGGATVVLPPHGSALTTPPPPRSAGEGRKRRTLSSRLGIGAGEEEENPRRGGRQPRPVYVGHPSAERRGRLAPS